MWPCCSIHIELERWRQMEKNMKFTAFSYMLKSSASPIQEEYCIAALGTEEAAKEGSSFCSC